MTSIYIRRVWYEHYALYMCGVIHWVCSTYFYLYYFFLNYNMIIIFYNWSKYNINISLNNSIYILFHGTIIQTYTYNIMIYSKLISNVSIHFNNHNTIPPYVFIYAFSFLIDSFNISPGLPLIDLDFWYTFK